MSDSSITRYPPETTDIFFGDLIREAAMASCGHFFEKGNIERHLQNWRVGSDMSSKD